MIDTYQKRDELFLKHKEEEAQRNRENELRLAQIYATALANLTQIVQITTGRCTTSYPQTKNFNRFSCQHLHNLETPNPTLPVQEMKCNFIIMV